MKKNLIIKKNIIHLFLYLLFSLVVSALSIFEFYLIKSLIDITLRGGYIFNLLFLFIAQLLAFVIMLFFKNWYRNILSRKLIENISNFKIQQIINEKYDSRFSPSLLKSKFINNPSIICENMIIGFVDLLNTSALLAGAIIFLFFFHWSLAVTSIIFSFILIFITLFYSKRGSKYSLEINKINNEYNEDVNKIISSRNELFLFNKINYFNSLLITLTVSKNKYFYSNYKKLMFFQIPSIILGSLVQVVSPIISSILSYNGFVPVSVIAVSSFLYGIAFSSLMAIPLQISGFVNAKKIYNSFLSNFNNYRKEEFDININKISLVNFNPLINGKKVFNQNLNLQIKKGQKIHIIGKNGSGKSTMINEIKNKGKNSQGKIITSPNLKSELINNYNVAFLSEKTHIFNGTVFENICFFSNSFDRKQVAKLIKLTNLGLNIDKVISKNNISDGQKQKIGIIRSLVIKRDFIFIDEGLNNISINDRKKIHDYLNQIDSAVILISHKRAKGGYNEINIDE